MGGGRDFSTGRSIYIRRNGVYIRRDGKEINHRNNKVPATLRKFNGNVKLAAEQYDELSESQKRDIDAGLAAIREYINKGDFRIRVTNRAMNGILDSGEIWNQMQAGRSGGYYDPDERRDISQRLFDHDGGLADEEYEKYGYLSDGQTDAAEWYGDFDIVLKKDVMMDRTTMTLGDSLDYKAYYPSFVNNPQWVSSGDKFWADPKDFKRKSKTLLKTGKFEDSGDGYLELQFHGKVTTNEISHISMPKSWKNNTPSELLDTIQRLKDAGIRIQYDAHD
ncbi:MAG: hypothetical protein IJI57_04280 [Flexilinea sp.]|nr:hypothetical protein [Flexilinea sp.]